MDLRPRVLFYLSLLFLLVNTTVSASAVFRVHHKFRGLGRTLSDFKAHDKQRHARILSAVDLPLGGTSLPSVAGLYYTEIGIGTPPKNYVVQVDTGSDIMWVNCIECKRCPKKSNLGFDLTLYNPKESTSRSLVTCDHPFCSSTYNGQIPGCTSDVLCQYSVMYGDGSTTSGYYVKDYVQYGQVSGNFQTRKANASVVFGCGALQSGGLGSSDEAVDGILGFGQSNSSMISQIASSGKVKKIFAHCLDSINGGGIFAIGNIVQPKMKMTPLVPNQSHYNVNMKAIEVGDTILQLPSDLFDTVDKRGAIIDSGTTLSYLPEMAYNSLVNEILSSHSNLKLFKIQESLCFQYTGSVDDGFPPITLHFEKSLSLTVYPHEYLFQMSEDTWCVGWQNSRKDGKDMTLLGDLVLSNKLVLYDLENQVIGWTEYNCSSTIKVKDEKTGALYSVGANNLKIRNSARSLEMGSFTFLVFLTAMLLNLTY
ncbi:aspartic proteinase 36-like isoform X2 [Tasmannia lanceolata]|uniref:aspartic proteinase 36-like isoform X2 n=1 Tax=Tasmannia lanceolata TaxID=3420 RepID=UPI00406432C8